jgi:mercuric ion transport protein
MNSDRESSGILAAAGIAAVLASSCCLGPLVLVLLGASGAWIGNLAALEAYRPLFLGLTIVALTFAGLRIFRPTRACVSDEVCSSPRTRFTQRIFFSVVAGLALIALIFPYFAHLLY